MERRSFYSPGTIVDALRLLDETGGRIIAGGTDVIPQMRDGRFQSQHQIDMTRITELRFIDDDGGVIRIGSLTTHDDIVRSSLLQREAAALVQASSLIGAPQTRNRGTLGGNIGNASPAGDTLPPLLVVNASVHLVSLNDERTIQLSEFLRGPSQTAMAAGELIHHIRFERLREGTGTVFHRLGSRAGMAISIASTAIALRLDENGIVKDARIALGAVAPTAIRCPKTEATLMTQKYSEDLIRASAEAAAQECSPIDDVRATTAYRRRAVEHLVRRALHNFLEKI